MTTLQEYSERWQARLDELAAQHRVPGATLAVGLAGETVELATGIVNHRTRVETTPDAVFHQASVTKMYTAVMVMQLVEERLVALDEPVQTYLPWLRFADRAAQRTITVRHLLSHTGGFDADEIGDFGRNDDAPRNYLQTLAELPQISEPGELYSYSNGGFVILGELIAELDGNPYAASLRKRITERLDVRTPITRPEEVILFRAAIGHELMESGMTVIERWGPQAGVAAGLGHMYVRAADLLAFLRMLVRGGTADDGTRLLTAASIAEMQKIQADIPDKTREMYAGLGMMMSDVDGHRVYGHEGNIAAFSSFARYVPERGFALAMLTNYLTAYTMFDELMKDVFRDAISIELPDAPGPRDDVTFDPQPYVGVYYREGLRIEVCAENGLLVARPSGEMSAGLPESVPLRPGADRSMFYAAMSRVPTPIPVTFGTFDERGVPKYISVGGRNSRRVE